MLSRIFWPFLLLLALAAPVQAAVDLVTLPTREGTQLTIYNSEDITMVREHRLLTVKEGVNRIQFSWANTLIDPTSIEFRILDQQDKVDLVDTTFPAGRNDALQWNIKSQMAGKIPVEIRYFTSGITWAADYVGIANEDETKLNVTGYVRVTNDSGELTTTPRRGWWWARSTWWRRSPIWREGRRRVRTGASYRDAADNDCDSNTRRVQQTPGRSDDKSAGKAADAERAGGEGPSRSSSRASPNTSSSPSKAARTSRTRSPSGWWP